MADIDEAISEVLKHAPRKDKMERLSIHQGRIDAILV